MIYYLDGRNLNERLSAHQYLNGILHFPETYGNNLDALYDVLTETGREVELRISHTDYLSDYGRLMLHTMIDAQKNNPFLTVIIDDNV